MTSPAAQGGFSQPAATSPNGSGPLRLLDGAGGLALQVEHYGAGMRIQVPSRDVAITAEMVEHLAAYLAPAATYDGPRFVGVADIKRIHGVTYQTVANWRRKYSDFPRPVNEDEEGARPLWDAAAVALWVATSRRRPGPRSKPAS